jgi:hypothetical protein
MAPITWQNYPTVTTPINAANLNLLAQKSTLVVNVKDPTYGATGDGTTDDTAAITAAITAAGTGTVFFPKGTYLVTAATDGISVPDGVSLVGEGAKSVIKAANSPGTNKSLLGVANAATVEVADLTLQGPTTWGGVGNGVTGIYSAASGFPTQIRCRGVRLIALTYAIRLVGVTRLLISDCELDGQGIGSAQTTCTGIHIADDTGGSFVSVRGSQFRGFGATDGLSHAFYPYHSVSFAVENCQFDQVQPGDILTPHNGAVPSNVPSGVVMGCRFTHTSTAYPGVRTQQYGKTRVIGNHFDVNQSIYMQGDCIIDNNSFVNVASAGSNVCIHELSTAAALYATISNNRFTNNNNYDIGPEIAAGSTFIITGNDFASGSNNGHVVSLAGTSPTIIAVGNNFRGQTANCDALEMNGSGSLYAAGNTFTNIRDAIRLNTGSTVTRVGAVGNHFNQGGASFDFVAAPTNVFTDGNYGTTRSTHRPPPSLCRRAASSSPSRARPRSHRSRLRGRAASWRCSSPAR